METLWVFMIVISGTVSPGPQGTVPGFVGGNVENISNMFFMSEKECNDARDMMVAQTQIMIKGLQDAKIEISECKAVEFTEEK